MRVGRDRDLALVSGCLLGPLLTLSIVHSSTPNHSQQGGCVSVCVCARVCVCERERERARESESVCAPALPCVSDYISSASSSLFTLSCAGPHSDAIVHSPLVILNGQ